ncbi:FUSC family protein [Halioxenophilus sp. WMMB6]|uniref:FUSC family protein n=1 Tax=Halioxenophilus sp. WMMB6 TaxID=3073815 RepID=UPI00295E5846|nr:FUSC family protein [Halioxenophilus sp. WMMB6]
MTVTLAIAGPVVLGAWLGQFELGVAASIGGLVSTYLRQTPLSHRMVTMAVVTVGFCAAFTLCLLVAFSPWLMVAALGLVAFWATFVCRYFTVPPPGSFFFILVAAIAGAQPFDLALLTERTGLLLLGCLAACALALTYSLLQLLAGHSNGVQPAETTDVRVVAIFLESATIALFIAISYLLALGLGFDNPYWAPISCAAILQGASFRAVWQRNVHRVVGTAIGMGLAWAVFQLHPSPWGLALLMVVLSFVIEWLVTRNYGLAVIFITPLTIILAEAKSASLDTNTVILLRMVDVLLGSSVGYLGGWLLHRQQWYAGLEQRLARMIGKRD